jgi:hypothetical protein
MNILTVEQIRKRMLKGDTCVNIAQEYLTKIAESDIPDEGKKLLLAETRDNIADAWRIVREGSRKFKNDFKFLGIEGKKIKEKELRKVLGCLRIPNPSTEILKQYNDNMNKLLDLVEKKEGDKK